MKKATTLILLSLATASISEAQTVSIDFTIGEGYSDAALNGQNGWTGAAAWTVDASVNESVSIGASAFANMYYGGSSLNPQDGTLRYTSEFKLNYTDGAVANENVFDIIRVASDTSNTNVVRWQIQYRPANGYRIRFYGDGGSVYGETSDFTAADIGLDDDAISDDLKAIIHITRGATAADWFYNITLENLTNATVVTTYGKTAAVVPAGLHSDTTVFFGFNSQQHGNGATVYNVAATVATDPNPNVIDFIGAEGYISGPVNGRNGWDGANDPTQWIVDAPSDTLGATGSFKGIYYGGSSMNPQDGTMTFAQDFKFDYTDTGGSNDAIDVFRISTVSTGNVDWIRLNLREAFIAGEFQFRVYTAGAGGDLGAPPANFTDADIGFGPADTISDDLRLVWNLTRGADENTWSFDVTLKNLTTGATVATWVRTADVPVPLNFHNDTSLFFGFNTYNSNSATVDSVAANIWLDLDQDGINFNTAEGYVPGTVDGQNGWDGSSWIVDTDDTTMSNSIGGNTAAIYGGASLNPQAGILVYTSDFNVNYTPDGANAADIVEMFTISSSGTLPLADQARLLLREASAGGGYHIRFQDKFGVQKTLPSNFSAADIGLDDDDQSDDLRVTMMVMRDASTADTWDIDVMLMNLTTGQLVAYWNPTVTVDTDLYADTDVFFGAVNNSANVYTISRMSAANGPEKIDFTSTEGYTTAALNGQNSWTAGAGISANVDPAKEWVFVGSGFNSAVYGGASLNPDQGTITYTQDFKITYDKAATEDVYDVFKLESDDPAEVVRVFLRYNSGTGLFNIRYSTGNGFDQNLLSSDTFLPVEIGLDGDNVSDDLRLTLSLTKGVDATAWSIDVSLVNLTSPSIVDIGYGADPNWNTTVEVNGGFHTDTSIQLGFRSPNAVTNAYVYNICFTKQAAAAPLLISVSASAGDIIITYGGGSLQDSPDLSTWTTLDPQPASPYQYTPAPAEKRFFRVTD